MKKIAMSMLLFLFIFMGGCGTALKSAGITAINFNIPVSITGGGYVGSPDGYIQPYGYYYPYSYVIVSNYSRYYLRVDRDGQQIATVPPQAEYKVATKVMYNEQVRIALSIYAYKLTADVKSYDYVGATTRQFSFYGNINEKRLETWQVRDYDLARP